METWHVYQLRSDAELLYVGYTRQKLNRRLGAHRREKPWWPEVTGIKSEQFATEDDARRREKDLWAAERPKYNRQSPFLTAEERDAAARKRVREWMRAHPERKAEWQKAYESRPEIRDRQRAYRRDWARRNRPTTVAGRRQGGRRQQPGPGLF